MTGGENSCYDALQHLTVAGNDNLFVVDNGGSVALIAGNVITMLPGTLVNSGGYFHGYITETGNFCSNPLSPVTSAPVNKETTLSTVSLSGQEPFIRLYPNPTSGICNLAIRHPSSPSEIVLTIYNMTGKTILHQAFSNQSTHQFSITDQPPGIYICHISTGKTSSVTKILKSR